MELTENDVMKIAEKYVIETLKKLQQQIEIHQYITDDRNNDIIFGINDTLTWLNKGGLRGN